MSRIHFVTAIDLGRNTIIFYYPHFPTITLDYSFLTHDGIINSRLATTIFSDSDFESRLLNPITSSCDVEMNLP
ncbi:unnamed protein product [Clavelina lepadiformis]|uniref:Uncharacterized protein n=1 Tax=Clavelina lepadiformis TaxID=159417 RepID=A0ABP0GSK1_CLALP